MLGHDHALSGALAFTAVAPLLPVSGIQLAVAATLTAGAGVLPDLDEPGSTIARTFGFLTGTFAWIVNRISGGHRKGTHSLLGIGLLTIAALWAGSLQRGAAANLQHGEQWLHLLPAGAQQFYGLDIDAIYADYFRRVREIAATGLVDCLAHIDLVKIHGHRPNAEIEVIAGETLDLIRSRNLAIELSTAGWRKPVNELYPSDRIIQLAIEKGIPFTTASDAHSHVQLGENFHRLAEKISTLGTREVCIFEKHRRFVKSLQS